MPHTYHIVLTRGGMTAICVDGHAVTGVFFGLDCEAEALREFPDATRAQETNALFVAAADAINAEGPGVQMTLCGTPFQHRVWHALTQTAWGETLTYKGLAARAGDPNAWRAAASACAANRLGILVPCHRVVRSVGDTGRYRWGQDLKGALLRQEGVTPGP